jgi:uncharacterized protein YgiM (DUF1202 family)
MMQRNEKEMLSRVREIISTRSDLFGTKKTIKAEKANLRKNATSKSKLIATIKKGSLVLEINTRKKWSQIIVLDEIGIDKTVWIYTQLLKNLI